MKWVSAAIQAIILFLCFAALNVMLNFVAQIVVETSKNPTVSFGLIPKTVVSLDLFIAHYALVVNSITLAFCVALPFIYAARKN